MKKLDRHSRKLLDTLIAGTPDYDRDVFTYEYICEISGVDENEMFRTVKHLVKYNYAEFASFNNDVNFGIALTTDGARYKEYSWIGVRDFLFRSIFTPIAVSAATALITLCITGFFR